MSIYSDSSNRDVRRRAIAMAFGLAIAVGGCDRTGNTGPDKGGNAEPANPSESGASTTPIQEKSVAALPTARESESVSPERACTVDADCKSVEYDRIVQSQADCYCPLCPGDYGRLEPVNTTTFDAMRAQWANYCAAWAEEQCEPFLCPLPDAPVCKSGRCEDPSGNVHTGPVPQSALSGER